MSALLQVIGGLCGLASLVCYILVVVQMFKRGQTGIGIASLVLLLACGIGGLVAFVYGWIKAKEWDIQNVMLIWTGCIVVSVLCNIAFVAVAGAYFHAPPPPHIGR